MYYLIQYLLVKLTLLPLPQPHPSAPVTSPSTGVTGGQTGEYVADETKEPTKSYLEMTAKYSLSYLREHNKFLESKRLSFSYTHQASICREGDKTTNPALSTTAHFLKQWTPPPTPQVVV